MCAIPQVRRHTIAVMRNLFRQLMHRAFNMPNHFRQRMHRAFNMPNHFRQLMHRAFNMLRKFWPRCLALKACLIAPRKPRLRWIMTAVATWLSSPSLAHGSPIRGGLTMRARRTSRAVWTFTKSPATTRANYLLIPPSRYPLLPAIDGLGIRGGGAHAPNEWAELSTVPELVQRTALLIYRLTR